MGLCCIPLESRSLPLQALPLPVYVLGMLTPYRVVILTAAVYLAGHMALWFVAVELFDAGDYKGAKAIVGMMWVWGPGVLIWGARLTYQSWLGLRR